MRQISKFILLLLITFIFLGHLSFAQPLEPPPIDEDLEEELDEVARPTRPIRPTIPPSRPTGGIQAGKIDLKTSGGTNGAPLLVESFDFQDANIEDVVKAISKLTNKNFMLDKNVTGKITIIANAPLTVDEAYLAFLSALEANKLTTVQSGKITKIIRSQDAKQSAIETYSGEYTPASDQFITRIYHLKFINAQDLANSIRDLAPRGGLVPYPATNSLIITDTGANISRLIDIIEQLDVKGFKEQLEVIPVKYASASEIAGILNDLYQEQARGGLRSRPTLPSSALTGPAPSKIIADDRTNSLIILGNQDTINNIKSLIAKIDFDVAGGGKIHVYYLQFADAEELAQTLSNLASGAASETSRRGQTAGRPQQQTGTTQVSAGAAVAELAGGVKVTADKATNSLVITASPQDYEALKVVIQQLDISRKQVYLEASIIELSNDQNGSFGISYTGGVPNNSGDGGVFGAFRTGQVDSLALFIAAAFGTQAGTGPNGGQFGWVSGERTTIDFAGTPVVLPIGTALVQTLLSETDANLLSAPRVLVLDNEEAKIKVGSKEPVSASAAITGTGIGQQSIDRIPVVLELKITPQINESTDYIRLKVSQSIEAAAGTVNFPTGNGGIASSIRTTERAVDSTVMIKDKDTAILGGLMQDNITEVEQKIPILGDIPLLGWLFKVAQTTIRKTNLILFLTPTIIHRNIDYRNLFDENMQEREQFIDRNAMGTDNKDWYINRNLKPPRLE